MSKKVTMQQIADNLGVSKFVVSKALSGKGGVSEATKERVIQEASQLGYFSQKNVHVRTMKLEQHSKVPALNKQSVLVLMPNIRFQTKESLYWGRILDGISSRLESGGYGMAIVSEQSVDHFLHFLNPNGILGLIGVGEISTSLLLEVHRIGLPMVLVDHEDILIPTDTVFSNNYECMYCLTKHLIGSGHNKLSFVGDVKYSRSFYDRFLGFRSAIEEQEDNGDIGTKEDYLLSVKGFEPDEFKEPIKQWVIKRQKSKTLPSVLICANDKIAIAAIHVIHELGLSVPEDVSVTGFDNIEDSYRMNPAITTVHVPKESLGKRAVERLLERIASEHEPIEKILLAGELLYRESSIQVKKD